MPSACFLASHLSDCTTVVLCTALTPAGPRRVHGAARGGQVPGLDRGTQGLPAEGGLQRITTHTCVVPFLLTVSHARAASDTRWARRLLRPLLVQYPACRYTLPAASHVCIAVVGAGTAAAAGAGCRRRRMRALYIVTLVRPFCVHSNITSHSTLFVVGTWPSNHTRVSARKATRALCNTQETPCK
jgi:hypothetical protein